MSLTGIPGIRVGHATDRSAATGCTVILCERGMIAGCDIGGGASGTREIEACRPGHLVGRVHGLVLAGGSAFGLDAACGVMRYLERRGIGFDTGVARVPIVPAAILFDLALGNPRVRPDAAMGLRACRAASTRPVRSGSIGAGTGATVGKILGIAHATKSGIGNALLRTGGSSGARVAALVAVNALGDVRDPETGAIVAGARREARGPGAHRFLDTAARMETRPPRRFARSSHTTLVVVATDARIDQVEATRLSRICQDGLARSISPAHTGHDGDIVFTLSAGNRRADPEGLAVTACRAIGLALLDAVRSATSLGGVPALRDLRVPRPTPPHS